MRPVPLLGALLLLLCVVPPAWAQQAMPVRVGEVRRESMSAGYEATGSLRARQRSAVAAEEPGRVLEVGFDVGDAVAEGDVLARLDARRLDAQRARAEATLAEARATLAEREAQARLATIELERLEPLRGRGVASDDEYDTAVATTQAAAARADAARSTIAAAEAELALLDVRLADAEVRAPFAGRVVERHVDPGARVDSGDPVVTVVSDGTLEAWLDVPERLAGRLGVGTGQAAEVLLTVNGEEIEARNVRLVAEVGDRVRTLNLLADVEPTPGMLPGMSVRAVVPLAGKGEQVTIPRDALIRAAAGPQVFAVRGGSAVPVPVEVLGVDNGRLAVRGPLEAGDQVVTEGGERLFPGMPVAVVE